MVQACPFCSTTFEQGSTTMLQCVADIGCEGKVLTSFGLCLSPVYVGAVLLAVKSRQAVHSLSLVTEYAGRWHDHSPAQH